MNNKRIGNIFEEDFARFLSDKGYWVAPFPGKAHTNSQPADLVACKNNVPILFDCKTLANKNGLFNLNRLEENQRLAFQRWKQCGNNNYYLAILWNNNIYFIDVNDINLENKSINLKEYKSKVLNFYDN